MSPRKIHAQILIADDEQTFGEGLADALRREGYECRTVLDGHAVAAELNTNPQYDLLIADIRMPGNDELQLIRHLPQIAEGLPVILVTAHPQVSLALQAAELPVLSYLAKPIELPELLTLVRRGVAHSAVYRANKAITQRLANWLTDVQMFHQMLARGTSMSAVGPEAFMKVSLRNVMSCLSELESMWQIVAANTVVDGAASDALAGALDSAMRAFRSTTAAFPG